MALTTQRCYWTEDVIGTIGVGGVGLILFSSAVLLMSSPTPPPPPPPLVGLADAAALAEGDRVESRGQAMAAAAAAALACTLLAAAAAAAAGTTSTRAFKSALENLVECLPRM